MRTVDYSEVLRDLGALLGVPLDQVTREEVLVWMSAINDATRYCWDWHDWADLTRVQELAADAAFPDRIDPERLEYGETIEFEPSYVSPITGKYPKVLAVYDREPLGVPSPGRHVLEMKLWGTTIVVDHEQETYWVAYKLPFLDYMGRVPTQSGSAEGTPFSAIDPAGVVAYARSDYTTFDTRGNWWVWLPGSEFLLESDMLRAYPYILKPAATRLAAAQLLEGEGRPVHAGAYRRQAMDRLEEELQREMDQDHRYKRVTVNTR